MSEHIVDSSRLSQHEITIALGQLGFHMCWVVCILIFACMTLPDILLVTMKEQTKERTYMLGNQVLSALFHQFTVMLDGVHS